MSPEGERGRSQTENLRALVREFQELAIGEEDVDGEKAIIKGWQLIVGWAAAKGGDSKLSCLLYLLANPGKVYDGLVVPTAIGYLEGGMSKNGEAGELLRGIKEIEAMEKAQAFCRRMKEYLWRSS